MSIKISDVISENDDLLALNALKIKLAESIDNSNSGRDIAALSRQLTQTLENIRLMKEERAIDDDDIALQSIIAKHKKERVRGQKEDEQ